MVFHIMSTVSSKRYLCLLTFTFENITSKRFSYYEITVSVPGPEGTPDVLVFPREPEGSPGINYIWIFLNLGVLGSYKSI